MGKFYISVLHYKSRLIWALFLALDLSILLRILEKVMKNCIKYYE